MQSSFPLYLFYLFLKVVVRISFALFYPLTKVLGKEHLQLKGPTIVATNHPNTLIDALNAASRVDEQLFFLVNAGLYATPWQANLFETLYCIPIERPQDAKGRPVRNEEAFARCYRHLGRGGHLFVAPEGGSEMEYRLRPIKTGTARIALGAEDQEDFRLDLRILPIGFTYGDPPHMGSTLLVNAGEPILLRDYESLYRKNPREAVLAVTEELRRRLSALILDTRDAEEERLIKRLGTLLHNTYHFPLDVRFRHMKDLLPVLRRIRSDEPPAWAAFHGEVNGYFERLSQCKINDAAVAEPDRLFLRVLGLLLAFPLFLVGFLTNALPFFIPRLVERKLDLYVGYTATVKILLALFTFPIAYLAFGLIVAQWLPWAMAVVLSLSLLPLGYFAWGYSRFFAHTVRLFRRWSLKRKAGGELDDLEKRRGRIMERLQQMVASPVV